MKMIALKEAYSRFQRNNPDHLSLVCRNGKIFQPRDLRQLYSAHLPLSIGVGAKAMDPEP
jgi:hypothetical protein